MIRPGSTTVSEALAILKNTPSVDPASVGASPSSDVPGKGKAGWRFQPGFAETIGRLYYEDDVVSWMEFDIHGALRLSDVITFLGQPTEVAAISGRADSRWLVIAFLWPDEGYVAIVFYSNYRSQDNTVEIKPDMRIEDIYYFDPGVYDQLLEARRIVLSVDREVVLESLQPWSGFTRIEFLEFQWTP